MKNHAPLIIPVLLCLIILSCDNETHEVMYSVDTKIDRQLAKIVYLNGNGSEKVITGTQLPWSYNFYAEAGDSIRLSARIFQSGNFVYLGIDTLRIIVYLDGEMYKKDSVVFQNSTSDVVTISDKL